MPVPKGTRIGGRQKGTPNRKTAETVAKIEAAGLTPLDYMLGVLRNENNDQATRLDAAHKAAPYVHAKLATIDLGNKDDKPFEQTKRIELVGVRPGDNSKA
jgi:hypothetical protein